MICWVPIEIPSESMEKENTRVCVEPNEKKNSDEAKTFNNSLKIYFHSCNIECFGIGSKANSLDVVVRRRKLHRQLTSYKQFHRKINARFFVSATHSLFSPDQLPLTTREAFEAEGKQLNSAERERRMCSRDFSLISRSQHERKQIEINKTNMIL